VNYIILNGVNSNTINGLLIQTLPQISKPMIRTQIDEIDGRDGDIVTPLGYAAYDKSFEIGLYGDYNIDDVIAFFNSAGTVTFSNEDDKFYYYEIIDQIDFAKLIRFKTATVTMHVQPFKYSLVDNLKSFTIDPQLLSFTDYTTTKNGITVTVANSTILVSGTGSAATEFYIPIPTVNLAAGSYILNAYSSGTSPNSCSFRLIYNSPSAANSFGGTYATLQNNATVSINATLNSAKSYNYIYFYISAGVAMDFSIDFLLMKPIQDDVIVRNNGNIIAKPTMTIYGVGTINFSLNGEQVFIIDLADEGSITIDSAAMEAYSDGLLKNRLVTGDYENFVFKVGANTITLTGEVNRMDIQNFSRWI